MFLLFSKKGQCGASFLTSRVEAPILTLSKALGERKFYLLSLWQRIWDYWLKL